MENPSNPSPHNEEVSSSAEGGTSLDLFLTSMKFNFHEVLTFLEKFGKQQYNPHFKIYPEDHLILFKLMIYFYQDENQCQFHNIDLRKGIFLTGPVGCGKTTLMSMMKHILSPDQQHIMISTRKIAFDFSEQGYQVIHKYSTRSFNHTSSGWTPKTFCFDDLGLESKIKHYGNKCNIMAEILLSRYDLFISHKMITHVTTNLSASEIEKAYGNRVRSRMREMFNLISFDKSSLDKRS